MTLDVRLQWLFKPEAQPAGLTRYRRLQRWWKALPVPQGLRLAITAILYRLSPGVRTIAVLDQTLTAAQSLVPRALDDIAPGRLIVSGYINDTSGIGRAGRMSLDVFRHAGLAPQPHDLRSAPDGWGRIEPGGVWFCHCNAMEAADFILRCEAPHACYRIGYWAWELPNLPPAWVEAIPLFHEIWAPSRFIAEAVERAAGPHGPVVRYVPHPLPQVRDVQPDRARYGLGPNVFAFLCMYDVHSSATRKNPMGAVRAFQMAFDPARRDVRLLVKVVAAAESQSCLDELLNQTQGWPNIQILTDMLTDEDANRLICSADAFVSLHRSEGFGLSIAQAMAMGRPVIVTGWSGNMDFCGRGAALVGYTLIPATDPHGVYRQYEAPGQVWAEPVLEDAVRAMRSIAADPDEARALGEAGQRHVERVLPAGYEVEYLRRWIA